MDNQILIIGIGSSPWDKLYFENVLKELKKNTKFIFYCDSDGIMGDYCKENNIDFYTPDKTPRFIAKIPKVGSFFRLFLYRKKLIQIKRKYKQFDAVHVHFLTLDHLLFLKELRKCSRKIICTFWGTDLFREMVSKIQLKADLLNVADYITFMTQNMKDYFDLHAKYNYESKIKILDFGCSTLGNIDAVADYQKKCKGNLGIDDDSVAISIGYNGLEAQQHLKVIDELAKLPSEIKKKIVIVLQLTYGLKDYYYDEIKNLIDKYSFKSVILTEFMNGDEVANLRVATDIFIHAQTTDAQSVSVEEFLYAKKLVLNPTWIQYSALKNRNVFYVEYSNFDEIPNIIIKYFDGYFNSEDIDDSLLHNYQVIKTDYSWSGLAPKWLELYK